eukprot:TRINITY_DN11453_c0_g1_i1.p1 TRINITY_DN11453_c0_g1~~TRINITY_DN11453_c0_g1_i1.p1  ORF type:complete len:257 (+),score=22.56 TRINITY_DN11453_c0_g1_i1:170-940(+)
MVVTWLHIGTDLLLASLMGVAMNSVASRVFPADPIKGDPRWVYYLSIFTQLCVFPPLAILSWQEQGDDVGNWFMNSWESLPSVVYSRGYLAAMWGYVFKDLAVLSNPLIVLHHFACMACVLIAGGMRDQGGLGFLILGTTIFELGTLFYNLSTLFFTSWLTRRIYWMIMTVTNIVGASVATYFCFSTSFPLPARLFFLVTGIALGIGRELEVWKDWRKEQEVKIDLEKTERCGGSIVELRKIDRCERSTTKLHRDN